MSDDTIKFDPKVLEAMAAAMYAEIAELLVALGMTKVTMKWDEVSDDVKCSWRSGIAAAWIKKREIESSRSLKGGTE